MVVIIPDDKYMAMHQAWQTTGRDIYRTFHEWANAKTGGKMLSWVGPEDPWAIEFDDDRLAVEFKLSWL